MSSSRHWEDNDDTLVDSDEADSILLLQEQEQEQEQVHEHEQERGALVRQTSSAGGYHAVTIEQAIEELHCLTDDFVIRRQAQEQACLSGETEKYWSPQLERSYTIIQNLQRDFGISWLTPLPAHDEDEEEDEDDDVLRNNDDSRLLLHSSGARQMRRIDSAAAEGSTTDGLARTALVRRGPRSHRHAQGSRRSHGEYSEGSIQQHRGEDNASDGGWHRGHSPGGIYTDRGPQRISTRSSRDFLGPEQSSAGPTTSSHHTQRLAPRPENDSRHIRDPGSVIPPIFRPYFRPDFDPDSCVRLAGDWVLDSEDRKKGKVKEDVWINLETGEKRLGPSHHSSTDAAASEGLDGEVRLISQPGQQEMSDDSDFNGADLSSSGSSHESHKSDRKTGRHKSNKSYRTHGSDWREWTNGQAPYGPNCRPRPISRQDFGGGF